MSPVKNNASTTKKAPGRTNGAAKAPARAAVGLSPARLIEAYRTMYTARKTDDKILILLKQGKVFFHIGGSGHEAAQVATGAHYPKFKAWCDDYFLLKHRQEQRGVGHLVGVDLAAQRRLLGGHGGHVAEAGDAPGGPEERGWFVPPRRDVRPDGRFDIGAPRERIRRCVDRGAAAGGGRAGRSRRPVLPPSQAHLLDAGGIPRMTLGPRDLASRYAELLGRVRAAEQVAGRPTGSTQLMAVTKGVDAERVAAAIDAGCRLFGENRVQELEEKRIALQRLRPNAVVRWELIGALQSNKVRRAVVAADRISSVDRLDVLERIAGATRGGSKEMHVAIQVNVDEDPAKSGFNAAALRAAIPAIGSVVAAGGIVDGRGMAAAFALGAEGITMGTRFVASFESPVHANYKNAIVAAPITGTNPGDRHGHS